jgi:class 3 adenylate cyclase
MAAGSPRWRAAYASGVQGVGTVTVLVTDQVGSTELRIAVGEEAADRLRQEHDRILRDVVIGLGGSVVKGTGDGIIATFSGAADAVSAAVSIQQAVHAWDAGDPGRQSVRVGLSAGDVTWDDGDCFGAPVIEASRLCAVAGGGQILAADVVRVLSRGRHGSTMNALGALELKGLPEPVTTYEVAWSPPPDAPGEGHLLLPVALRTDREFPFAGRDEEVARLREHWRAAATGNPRLVLLAGEPGIGKTRLAAELAQAVHHEGANVLYGRCDEEMGLSYQPFVDALQHFVAGSDPEIVRRDLGPHGGDLARLCPDITTVVPGLAAPLQSDPEAERYRLFDAVRGWVHAAARERPLLVVLDDLHAAAKPTLMLLRHVVRGLDRCRLLLVATYRDTELGQTSPLADTLADLRTFGSVERVSLGGLDANALGDLLAQPPGSALTHAVFAETEGNPFFTREVLRHLQESGALTKRDGRWSTNGPIDNLGIPEGVREVVGRRLARLSSQANEALSSAAVIGNEFTVGVLSAMRSTDEDELIEALDEAVAARLLAEVGIGAYRFAHALVRSTLYEEFGLTMRVRLHKQVGLALESTEPDDVVALAHHFALAAAAGEARRAAGYMLLAARQAITTLAIDDANERALAALELLAGGDEPDDMLRCDALTCLGEAQRLVGDPNHRETLLEAARIARSAGDVDRLVAAAMANVGGVSDEGGTDSERIELLEAALDAIGDADSIERARLLAALARELGAFGGAASPQCFGIADDALAMARRVGDLPTLSFVLHLHIEATGVPHTLTQRLAAAAEGVELATAIDDPIALGWALTDDGLSRAQRGELSALWSLPEKAGRIGEEYGCVALQRPAYLVRAWRAHHEGRIAEADELAEEAFRVFSETGHRSAFAFYAAQLLHIRRDQGRIGEILPLIAQVADDNPTVVAFQSALCLAYAEEDQLAQAEAVLRRLAVDEFSTIPYDSFWLSSMAACAEVSARVNDRDTAAVLHALLLPYEDQFAITVMSEGAVAHFVGAVAGTCGWFEDADAAFASAAAMEEKAGAVICAARTHVAWARMLLDRGAPDDAGRAQLLLDDALSTARRVGLPTVERRALALRDRCAV